MDGQVPLIALIVVSFLASVIQGATGVGFGLFAVAALSLLAPPKDFLPILALLNFPVVVYVFVKLRDHVLWDHLRVIIIALLIGIPLGIFALVKAPADIILRALAIVLIFAAVNILRPVRKLDELDEMDASADDAIIKPLNGGIRGLLIRFGVGLSTGALAGAFNTGGPPIIAYVYSIPWTKEQRAANMQAVFLISLIVRIVLMGGAKMYTVPALLDCAIAIPAAFAGMWVGYSIFKFISPRMLELGAAIFLFITAAKLLISP